MNTNYFKDGRPILNLIVNKILNSANINNFPIEGIAVVGGWSKELNSNNLRFPTNQAHSIEIERLISNSDKKEGDLDLVIFSNNLQCNWVNIISEELNRGIPYGQKNGKVDIVISLPMNVRPPGIELILTKENQYDSD